MWGAAQAFALACTRSRDASIVCKALCISKSIHDAVLACGARSLTVSLSYSKPTLEQQGQWLCKPTYRRLVHRLELSTYPNMDAMVKSTLQLAVTAVQPTELQVHCQLVIEGRPVGLPKILCCMQPKTLVLLDCEWAHLTADNASAAVENTEQLTVSSPQIALAVPLFQGMQRLQKLVLINRMGSGAGLLKLKQFTQLQGLALGYSSSEQQPQWGQQGAAWPKLQKLQRLEVKFHSSELCSTLAKRLAQTTQLTSLHVVAASIAPDDPHIALRTMQQPLQQLVVLRVFLEDVELPPLGRLSCSVKELHLTAPSLSAGAVVDVCCAKHLQHLRLEGTVSASQLAAVADSLVNLETLGLGCEDQADFPAADDWGAVLRRPVMPRLRQLLLWCHDNIGDRLQALQGVRAGLAVTEVSGMEYWEVMTGSG